MTAAQTIPHAAVAQESRTKLKPKPALKQTLVIDDVKASASQWRANVDDYRHLQAFSFETNEDIDLALDAFTEDPSLSDIPFKIVGGKCFWVPQEAKTVVAKSLSSRKIQNTSSRVLESRDVSPATMAKLRRRKS